MTFQLPPLPYAENALEPFLSADTMRFHHGKHHATYVSTLNSLVKDSALGSKSLEEIIRLTANDKVNQKCRSSTMPLSTGTTASSGSA